MKNPIYTNKITLILLLGLAFAFQSCKKKTDEEPVTPTYNLVFKYHFDSTQVRLNNFGQPTGIPAGNGAQSPRFNLMSSHYIELATDSLTLLGNGEILYRAPETSIGGSAAIDFSQSIKAGEGQSFYTIPLKSLAAGTYKWLRISLAYQNYDIRFRAAGFDLNGTLASFIGFNTYITSFAPSDSNVVVNGNRLQGYWAFEIDTMGFNNIYSGQATGTTVPNPLSLTSPVPAGSCVVTGAFDQPLVITGNETKDIVINVSLSVNNSFEWTDVAGDNIYEPAVDAVVDMGIRGVIPYVLY